MNETWSRGERGTRCLRAGFCIRWGLSSLPARNGVCRSSWKGNNSLIVKNETDKNLEGQYNKLTFLEYLLSYKPGTPPSVFRKTFILKPSASIAWCGELAALFLEGYEHVWKEKSRKKKSGTCSSCVWPFMTMKLLLPWVDNGTLSLMHNFKMKWSVLWITFTFSNLKLLVLLHYQSSQSSWVYCGIEQMSKWVHVLDAKVLAEKQGPYKYKWGGEEEPLGMRRAFTVSSRSVPCTHVSLHVCVCMYTCIYFLALSLERVKMQRWLCSN